jgi:hypothetical protein
MGPSIEDVFMNVVDRFVDENMPPIRPYARFEEAPTALSEIPLIDKAAKFGVAVRVVPSGLGFPGYYDSGSREVLLESPEAKVFFRLLAEVVQERHAGALTRTEPPWRDIQAELVAVVLHEIFVGEPDETLGNSYRTIARSAAALNMGVVEVCIRAFNDTEKILQLILE